MSSHTNQSINDDQELAKVLAGVSQEADNNMQFEETGSVAAPSTVNPATISPDPAPTKKSRSRRRKPARQPILSVRNKKSLDSIL